MDWVRVWLLKESNVKGIAGYFTNFVNEEPAQVGLKLR